MLRRTFHAERLGNAGKRTGGMAAAFEHFACENACSVGVEKL